MFRQLYEMQPKTSPFWLHRFVMVGPKTGNMESALTSTHLYQPTLVCFVGTEYVLARLHRNQ